MSNANVCVLCGDRPEKLPDTLHWETLSQEIEREIRRSIFAGYDTFCSGMAMGLDIHCCEILLKVREDFPYVKLYAYLPCETQANHWPETWRERYFSILERCSDVYCLQDRYTSGCMAKRSRLMVNSASKLIAVCTASSGSDAAYTFSYARDRSLEITQINPSDYKSRELM